MKKKGWAIIIIGLSFLVLTGCTQHSNTGNKKSIVSSSKKVSKLTAARTDVNSLFDVQYTEIRDGVEEDEIEAVNKEVNSLPSSNNRTKLKKHMKAAYHLFPAYETAQSSKDARQAAKDSKEADAVDKSEAIASSKKASSKALAASKKASSKAAAVSKDEVAESSRAAASQAAASSKAIKKAAKYRGITVSGTGNNVSQKFSLTTGYAIITANNAGSSNFVVDMKNGDGTDFKSILINEIGNYSGSLYIEIPTDGDYLFSVESDGNWNFNIVQKINPAKINKSLQASGSGTSVIFMKIPKNGSYKITTTNSGESNFVVMNGEDNLLVNEIGNYSGSQIQGIDAGTYPISIESDGNWTIKFEKM